MRAGEPSTRDRLRSTNRTIEILRANNWCCCLLKLAISPRVTSGMKNKEGREGKEYKKNLKKQKGRKDKERDIRKAGRG